MSKKATLPKGCKYDAQTNTIFCNLGRKTTAKDIRQAHRWAVENGIVPRVG